MRRHACARRSSPQPARRKPPLTIGKLANCADWRNYMDKVLSQAASTGPLHGEPSQSVLYRMPRQLHDLLERQMNPPKYTADAPRRAASISR